MKFFLKSLQLLLLTRIDHCINILQKVINLIMIIIQKYLNFNNHYLSLMMLVISRRVARTFCSTIESYGISSRIGGFSQDRLYEVYAGKFQNKALEKMKPKLMKSNYGTNIITTAEECLKCLQILKKVDNIVAWDTETIDLDVKNESPVGKGKIICASFFAGPEYNFGNGPKVFIDNFGTNAGLIHHFKSYLEDQKYKKVWHNYGFDRHVFQNHGINVKGFGGDTMHMARLYDPAKMFGEYALSSLTKEYGPGIREIMGKYIKKKTNKYKAMYEDPQASAEMKEECKKALKNLENYTKVHAESSKLQKVKMQHLFRRKKILKGGQEGKTYQFPSTLTLHTKEQHLEKWIAYSVLDSESTFFLRETLEAALKGQKSKAYEGIKSSWQIYEKYWRPFGQLLTDMERQGFKINMGHIDSIQQQAKKKIEQKKQEFMSFLLTYQDDKNIDYFNPSSHMQMQQLLHAPFEVDPKRKEKDKKVKEQQDDAQLRELKESAEDEDKRVVNRVTVTELPKIRIFKVDNQNKQRGNAKIDMAIEGLGIPPIRVTAAGLPSVDEQSLSTLAGSPKKNGRYGKALEHFKDINQQQFGKKLCQALQVLIEMRQTETLLQTFIQPLKGYVDKNNRIHCSLNINTETGRLSSRKPNLQNQPALEKDIFKIRSAFTCEKGNKLIVADYGQLELRVLAHLTKCTKMIQAFVEGGDFHSRTAIGMFDYIRKDIEEQKVLLEWDKSKGAPPVPLLKEKYAAERRKAKTVNFSIAYGKSAHGFAEDWNCTVDEAKQVIKAWFSDRKEVEAWQKEKQEIAKTQKYTQTLLGRRRGLSRFFGGTSQKGSMFGMGLRRAINTPIQGGAADIVIAAMVKLHQNEELRKLGWKLLLQIHDELILEGPEQSVQRAFEIVKNSMSHPFEKDLLVELQVDAKIGTTWYECK